MRIVNLFSVLRFQLTNGLADKTERDAKTL